MVALTIILVIFIYIGVGMVGAYACLRLYEYICKRIQFPGGK